MTDAILKTSLEQRIISSIIQSRSAYDSLIKFGDCGGLSSIGRHLAEDVGRYYDSDSSVRRCDVGVLLDRAGRLPNDKHVRAIREFVNSLPSDISAANVLKDIREHRVGAAADKLSLALANRDPDVSAALAEYTKAVAETEPQGGGDERDHETVDGDDVSDLLSDAPTEPLIKLWPRALNDLCDGGAQRGHQILIFGRPESGKTLVTINLVAGFLHQGLAVLYVANEEPLADIRGRIRQRLLKISKHQLLADRVSAAAELSKLSIGRWKVAGLAPGTIPQIRKLVDEFKPDVLVLDQLRNIRVGGGNRVEELENVATAARNLGKGAGILVVAITQAGDSASGKAVLEMNDVDGSKTGIPAQADLMLGVGNVKSAWDAGMLTLTTCKNKLSGRHESVTVHVNKATGQIK